MTGAAVVESQRLESAVVDDDALVEDGVVDVVQLVAGLRLDVAREDGTAVRVDRRQHELGQVARYTPAHTYLLQYHINCMATYSQQLTIILNLTLYDPGIPEHTLLTLHEPRNKAFCKPATSPVDGFVASL